MGGTSIRSRGPFAGPLVLSCPPRCRTQKGAIGRRLFGLTNGRDGRPPVGEAAFVVTHDLPIDRPFPDAPSTFVTDGVESAVAKPKTQAKAFAGDGTSPSARATRAGRRSGPGWSTGCARTWHRSCSVGAHEPGIRGVDPVWADQQRRFTRLARRFAERSKP
jgi:hypothetical protein